METNKKEWITPLLIIEVIENTENGSHPGGDMFDCDVVS